jgi:hypothetical protein
MTRASGGVSTVLSVVELGGAVPGGAGSWIVLLACMVLAAACVLWWCPKGRRIIVAVPLVVVFVAVTSLGVLGRQALADADAAAEVKAMEAHESRCLGALRLAEAGLLPEARAEVSAAITGEVEEPTSEARNACQAARAAVIAGGEGPLPVVTPTSPSPPSTKAPDLLAAVTAGVQRLLEPVLNPGGTEPKLVLGPWGWVALGLLFLGVLAGWTALCFWVVRRLERPRVRLNDPVAAAKEVDPALALGLGAEVRRLLFDDDFQKPLATSVVTDDVAGLLEEAGAPGSKLAAGVTRFMQKALHTTNTITASIFVTGQDRAILEVLDDRRGATVVHHEVRSTAVPRDPNAVTVPSDSVRDLARPLFSEIKSAALDRPDAPQMPGWMDLPAEALALLVAASAHLDSGNRKEAILLHEQARRLAPDNAVVVSQLGALLEMDRRHFEAFCLYVEHANRWPRVFEIRHRLAATLAMSDQWLRDVARAKATDRARAAALLRTRAASVDEADAGTYLTAADHLVYLPITVHASLLALADLEWTLLERYLRRSSCAGRTLSALKLGSGHADLSYQHQLLFGRGLRRKLLAIVKCSRRATFVQQLAPWPTPLAEWPTPGDRSLEDLRASIEQLANDPVPPVARYALACGYGRLWQVGGCPGDAQAAVDQLDKVVRADPEQWMATVLRDPDLAATRDTAAFQSWLVALRPDQCWDTAAWLQRLCLKAADRWLVFSHLDRASDQVPGTAQEILDADDQLLDLVGEMLSHESKASACMVKTMQACAGKLAIRLAPPPTSAHDRLPDIRQQRVYPAGATKPVHIEPTDLVPFATAVEGVVTSIATPTEPERAARWGWLSRTLRDGIHAEKEATAAAIESASRAAYRSGAGRSEDDDG